MSCSNPLHVACGESSERFGQCRLPTSGSVPSSQLIRAACNMSGIPMAEASVRWLIHHSVLSTDHHDAIILGASKLEHIHANLASFSKGPLPMPLVRAFDDAWELTRSVSDAYFRGYGVAAGSSDTFLRMHQANVPRSAV